jgi:hypothetical protein
MKRGTQETDVLATQFRWRKYREKIKTCVIRKQNRSTVNTPALTNVTTQQLGDQNREERDGWSVWLV